MTVKRVYKYYVSLSDLSDALSRLDFKIDELYLENGSWKNPGYSFYLKKLTSLNGDIDTKETLSGLGLFKNTTDDTPILIVDFSEQYMYVLDKNRLNEFIEYATNKTSNKDVRSIQCYYISISFKSIFDDECTWQQVVDSLLEEINEHY